MVEYNNEKAFCVSVQLS